MDTSSRIAVVADDHELFRAALSSILSTRLGFAQVIETASLDEALEVLGEAGAELALFDLTMPGMESASNLLAVRECFPEVRVAVVSGSTERRDILLALEAGVHGYVPKTLSIDAITAALRQVLDGAIYVPASLAAIDGTSGRVFAPAPTTVPTATLSAGDGEGQAAALSLTPRQREVLALLTQGRSNKEISRELNLGEGTVKVHMAALFRALGVQSRAAAAAIGARSGGAT